MRYIVILLLFFSVACDKDSGGNNESSQQETDSSIISDDNTSGDEVDDSTGDDSGNEVDELPSDEENGTTGIDDAKTREFMTLVNNHRVSIGLKPLIHDDLVAQIVTEHSENMANGFVPFGHLGFSSRCSEAGQVLGGSNWCGENVAAGQNTPQAAFNAWMNSPGHRANIEKSSATHTGFGYAKSITGKYYWSQIFLQAR